jgi:glutamyl-tRNA synthetase
VLVREDGVPLYTFASVVDDGEMGVTHVIRGEDHVSNTAVQTQIFEALGFAVPQFAHLALLKTKDGELSKRVGGNDIRSLREAGVEPMAIVSLLAKLGTSDPVEAVANIETLIAGFDFARFGRAPANYDIHELEKLNARLLHQLPFAAVRERLAGIDGPFWLSVRANIQTLGEVRQWWEMVHGDIASTPLPDKEFLHTAQALLPGEPWSDATWGAWTKALSEKTGRKGKELFMPLRLALTAREHGPEMKALLPLIGHAKVLQRLKDAAQ